jgi:hypothetical protein
VRRVAPALHKCNKIVMDKKVSGTVSLSSSIQSRNGS